MNNKIFKSIQWDNQILTLLDQRRLPHQEVYLECASAHDVFDAIVNMAVRGAPAIGVAAAYGVLVEAHNFASKGYSSNDLLRSLFNTVEYLSASRPTAVNLFWALNRIKDCLSKLNNNSNLTSQLVIDALTVECKAIYDQDIQTNLAIAKYGFELVPDNASIIHHCNTGSLATVEYGTALGVIRYAHEQGKNLYVYLDETRPRFQGANLSAFELKAFGIPHSVIVDSASGFLMKTKRIDLCIVGCDRVAANGDTANKIGTYNLALAAHAHGVPFYVACPVSTIDFGIRSGDEIEIEERSSQEITEVMGQKICPDGTSVWNPAFDVTPAGLITGFITEQGVFKSNQLSKINSGT
jgi:methylthioribose-1-phosphate isomerase